MVIDTKQETEIMAIYTRADRLAEEAFSSVRTVHAFWAPQTCPAVRGHPRRRRRGRQKEESQLRRALLHRILLYLCGYGLAFWQSVRMYHRDETEEAGDVVTVILTVLLAAQALTQIAPQTVILAKAAAAADELFRTIDRPSLIDSLSDARLAPDACRGEI